MSEFVLSAATSDEVDEFYLDEKIDAIDVSKGQSMKTTKLSKIDIMSLLYAISEEAPEESESASLAGDLAETMDTDFPDDWVMCMTQF